MDPVQKVSVSTAAIPALQKPNESAPNKDVEAAVKVATVPAKPKVSIHEFGQDVKQVAEEAMAEIQHFISSQQRSVKVSKDEASGYMVVQLVDPSSGEVIRTLPSEELLRIARTFEMLGSVMVNQRA
jgi:flagellar protein FlaG